MDQDCENNEAGDVEELLDGHVANEAKPVARDVLGERVLLYGHLGQTIAIYNYHF